LFLVLTGFGGAAADRGYIVLLSTTSTVNSGLLDAIVPRFTEKTGIEVRVVVSGSGQALRSARTGDGDVVLVHSRLDEEKFVAEGYGVERVDLMYNDFVVVGPSSDPAGVRQAQSVAQAFSKIAEAGAYFVSRGDWSGTHVKERRIWELTDRDFFASRAPSWYQESGVGMGAALNITVNKFAYTLSDRATWIRYERKNNFEICFEGDNELFNPYSLILVNPEKHPYVNAAEGQAFIDWLIGNEGRQWINSYRVGGKQLFFANAK
jgi:tungstate transport system substrate-binding protein